MPMDSSAEKLVTFPTIRGNRNNLFDLNKLIRLHWKYWLGLLRM